MVLISDVQNLSQSPHIWLWAQHKLCNTYNTMLRKWEKTVLNTLLTIPPFKQKQKKTQQNNKYTKQTKLSVSPKLL